MDMSVKILCDRTQIDIKLDGRRIKWLVERYNEIGINIEYKALVQLLNNRADWKLTYAVGLCQIFKVKIGDLFYFEDNSGERLDIDFV
jgi:DNA-binding XRE family transcriptional regulator